MPEEMNVYAEKSIDLAINYGPKLLLAIITLLIGLWLIRVLVRGIDRAMDSAGLEATLQRFLVSFSSVALKAVLFVSVIQMLGVETTSLIAMVGAAGLAVGLALQGSLANFAGGVLILFFKPFKLGDVIEAQGFVGVVNEIQIFNTILLTLDNQRVVIPNGMLSNDCIKNVFVEDTRRVDLTFGVSYSDEIPKVREVLKGVISEFDQILAEPEPDIFVSEHGDSSVNFLVRVWVKSEDYWPVHFGLIESVKIAFDREGISIPFPQRDLHMIPPPNPA